MAFVTSVAAYSNRGGYGHLVCLISPVKIKSLERSNTWLFIPSPNTPCQETWVSCRMGLHDIIWTEWTLYGKVGLWKSESWKMSTVFKAAVRLPFLPLTCKMDGEPCGSYLVYSCAEVQVFRQNCNVLDGASWTWKMSSACIRNHLGNVPTRVLFKLKLCSSSAEEGKKPSLGLQDVWRGTLKCVPWFSGVRPRLCSSHL